jgi:hypothetical protein
MTQIGKASGNDVFRKAYRQLTDEEKVRLERIKDNASALYNGIVEGPPSRMQSLALTKLEEAVMWAVKDITA